KGILLACCLAGALAGQETRGTILGRVTDSTGAIVPNATVRASNIATGVSAEGRSNAAGNFTLPYLLPGTYTLQAELAGFKKSVREGIEIRVNDTVEVDIEVTVGNVPEAVGFHAERP